MTRCHTYFEDGVCGHAMPPPPAQYIEIAYPVGAIEGARPRGNEADDVRTVQSLLNDIPEESGGPSPKLVVDGLCGPKTRKAIRKFQTRQFPGKIADGIVDKNQNTIARLNELARPDAGAELIVAAQASLGTAAVMVMRTIQTLGRIRMLWSLPNPISTDNAAAKVLDYHFKIGKSPDRLADIDFLLCVYQDILTVSGHVPRGPNQKSAFGILSNTPSDAKGKRAWGYAWPGGWRLHGQTRREPKWGFDIRIDTIYISQNALAMPANGLPYMLIHEMAHFVGGTFGEKNHIDDFATRHRDRVGYETLSREKSLLNADCYGQYAYEVNFGRPFVK